MLAKFRTTLLKIVKSKVLIKLARVPANNFNMVFLGGSEGVTELQQAQTSTLIALKGVPSLMNLQLMVEKPGFSSRHSFLWID